MPRIHPLAFVVLLAAWAAGAVCAQPAPSAPGRPPVVLVNGWQPGLPASCPVSGDSSATFGSLASAVRQPYGNLAGAPAVYFFDNCLQCPNCQIEDLAKRFAIFLSTIPGSTGGAAPQVDVVAHSFGGLIVRTYLAGMQPGGTFAPPADPHIRKLVLIATPNFGSYQAANQKSAAFFTPGPQTNQLKPGTAFLWNLARWNQNKDDLRGIETIGIIGNAGTFNGVANVSDGVVSLTSAALGFSPDAVKTRILNYCHTDDIVTLGCRAPSIANVDEAPETGKIILSFLAGSSDWTSVGTAPKQDQYLSQYGGIYFADQTASGQYVTDFTHVSFGQVALQSGDPTSGVFYDEFVGGSGLFQGASASLGAITCGPFTEIVGHYSAVLCKPAPFISSVGPLLPNIAALIVQSGGTISISGNGFGQRCATCAVSVYPGGVPLQVVSWTDQSISVSLPASYSGLVTLMVQAEAGQDTINIMTGTQPPGWMPVTHNVLVFNYTVGAATPAPQIVPVVSASDETLSWTVSSNAAWLSAAPKAGTTPANLTVTVDPSGLPLGTSTGILTVSTPNLPPQTVTVMLNITVPESSPVITGIANAAGGQAGVFSGAFISIYGTNLSPVSADWSTAIVNGVLPTQLGGVSVTVGGKPAFLFQIIPSQINAIAPDVPAGPVQVVVTTPTGSSTAFTANALVYGPAFWVWPANQPVATHTDYSIAAKDGTIAGVATVAAKPGETIILWGTGFGPVTPPVPAGQVPGANAGAPTASPVSVSLNDLPVPVIGAVLSGYPADYQVAIQIPASLSPGDYSLIASIAGVSSPPLTLTVQP